MHRRDPDCANIGFWDAYQEWRHFENMYQGYQKQGVYFWWQVSRAAWRKGLWSRVSC
jgi:hypothetical protein